MLLCQFPTVLQMQEFEDGENFLTLSESGLISANDFPYKDGLLYTDTRYNEKMKSILKPVRAITVNTATGSETTKGKLLKKFNPDIETMEGATFFLYLLPGKYSFSGSESNFKQS